ncbi:EamA family transporter [Herbiconiux sp. L3-i23]|uniref:EamA family transporter n=1 Tax=Herbiconiux sp. L3-i23 TaxID=2905871 RepID=UPI0020686655|nr:EamA family transporter [Herbiconiux sp. L3-i23]BDI23328.1 hypothetical protein L3i23_21040 [Herbiconiux sp. L3-i23]
MTAVLAALVAAAAYGTSDFFGGLAARRRGTVTGTTAVYAAATIVALGSMLVLPWRASPEAVVAGVAAGLFAIVGFLFFYAALAIGPMSVLSPSIALVNTLVPVVAAVLLGERLGPLGWTGVGAALAAGVLVSLEPRSGAGVRPRGLLLAVAAGLLLGASIVALDAAPKDAGVLPAVLDTGVGFVAIIPLLLLVRRARGTGFLATLDRPESAAQRPDRFASLAIGAGVLLGISNILIVLALQGGELAIVSVLVSLYPVVTVVLAAAVLRERLALPQLLGVALALLAAALLSLS